MKPSVSGTSIFYSKITINVVPNETNEKFLFFFIDFPKCSDRSQWIAGLKLLFASTTSGSGAPEGNERVVCSRLLQLSLKGMLFRINIFIFFDLVNDIKFIQTWK